MFPDGFYNEVQIVATVMSLDPDVEPDIPAMIGASAALAISGIPFTDIIAGARVGYINDSYLLNPTLKQLETSKLDLVVAGTKSAVLMVESQANELPEETMLKAVMFGHEQMQVVVQAISEFVEDVGKTKWNWAAVTFNIDLESKLTDAYENKILQAYSIREKLERRDEISKIYEEAVETFLSEENEDFSEYAIKTVLHDLEKKIVRNQIIDGQLRIDGRDCKTIRPITTKVGIFPRTHGSANFTRGETQALVTTTLSTQRNAQIIDSASGESKETFMLHYNFPPYCVGEIGPVGSPKRRELGHGNLARRALLAVMPDVDAFPYTVRVVSEITESNGSSSMASVCGGCLALMDAGVPIKAPVAGIAMGLIKEGEKYAILSDILGDEDHLGDMDFKVAGTSNGVTALQMDIKINGITEQIMRDALQQAKEGRMHILELMQETLPESRKVISDYAPRITTMRIHPDKIREVIGKGGEVIKGIIEATGAEINIDDNGEIKIACVTKESETAARKRIESIIAEPEVGKVYEGTVMRIVEFGAFVNIMPGKDGLLHISQISSEHIEKVTDKLIEGQIVNVKLTNIDQRGRLKLSMKDAER